MSLKNFLELVEIKTKIASIFPYIIGLLFSLSYFKMINIGLSLLFLIAMLLFDMTVTAINNYQDFKKPKMKNIKSKKTSLAKPIFPPDW